MKDPKLLTLVLFLLTFLRIAAQDTIVFENTYPYLVDVVEESETRIIYRKYSEKTNLAYILQKRFVTEIRYEDPASGKLKFKPDTLSNVNKLELWIGRKETVGLTNGRLLRMDDSTLILKKKSVLFDKNRKDAPEVVYIFPYSQIDYIYARKQNRIVQYALGSAAAGFFLGTISGLIAFKDSEPCEPLLPGMGCDESLQSPRSSWEKSLSLGFGAAGVGALAGGVIGAIKLKIPIGGKKDLFNAAVPRLNRLERALKQNL